MAKPPKLTDEHGWVSIPCNGKCEVKAILGHVPMGPYILEYQHDRNIEGMDWYAACRKVVNTKMTADFYDDFNNGRLHGYRIFANVQGKAVLVAYHYDTSD